MPVRLGCGYTAGTSPHRLARSLYAVSLLPVKASDSGAIAIRVSPARILIPNSMLMHPTERPPVDIPPTPPCREKRTWARNLFFVLAAINFVAVTIGSHDRFVTAGESRALAAGLSHWAMGDFGLADESPPLTRMVATLPILPLRPTVGEVWGRELCHDLDAWSRFEDLVASNLAASTLPDDYLDMVRLARLAGYFWWLLGAWLIVRWARELFGAAAGGLALILWAFGPNVLAAEAAIDSALPAAVTAALATYLFRLYQRQPSWEKACGTGLLLGMALLIDYLLIALIPAWAVPWAVSRLRGGVGRGHLVGAIAGMGRAALVIFTCLSVINLGYGLRQDWQPVKGYAFDSLALAGTPSPGASRREPNSSGNRFRGSRLGDLVIPIPPAHLRGLDRRLAELEGRARSSTEGGRRVGPREAAATIAARVPLGVGAMVLWTATLSVVRRKGGVPVVEELTLWAPVGFVLAAMGLDANLVTADRGLVLTAPFAIIGISRLARSFVPGRWVAGSLVLALTAWAVVGGLAGSWGGRTYLNEAVGGSGSLRAQSAYGSGDGGRDLLALKAWSDGHPEARPLAIAVRHVVGLKPFGLPPDRPPVNPGPAVANRLGYDRRVGPSPGYYALDISHLRSEGYWYFQGFRPMARIGSAIVVYHVTEEGADRVRRELGLPSLDAASRPSISDRGFLRRDYRGESGDDSHYTVFVPYTYTGDRPYPLILFLHGVGDAGTEGDQYLKVGLPPAIEARKESFGFITVIPQGRRGVWSPDSWDTRRAMAILDRVEREYHVDRKRSYLTGLSSGGTGVWDLAAHGPGRWAAIVPVSTGDCDPASAPLIKDIPCWCFHNVNDVLSPPTAPREMIAALRRAGGTPRYSEFFHPAVTNTERHNAWDAAYGDLELYGWLLEHRSP